MATLEQRVMDLLVRVLELPPARQALLHRDAPLLGALPELDSMAVLAVLEAIEAEFAITIPDEELTGAVFGSVASLTAFIASRLEALPQ